MTRRPAAVALRQDVALARLAVARGSRPCRPASLDPAAYPALAVLTAAENLLALARLARMQSREDEDPIWRMRVVYCGALVTAIAADVRTGTTDASRTLYLAVVDHQAHRKGTK